MPGRGARYGVCLFVLKRSQSEWKTAEVQHVFSRPALPCCVSDQMLETSSLHGEPPSPKCVFQNVELRVSTWKVGPWGWSQSSMLPSLSGSVELEFIFVSMTSHCPWDEDQNLLTSPPV